MEISVITIAAHCISREWKGKHICVQVCLYIRLQCHKWLPYGPK